MRHFINETFYKYYLSDKLLQSEYLEQLMLSNFSLNESLLMRSHMCKDS